MSGLYKGFIATKGKEPIEKYKGLNTFRTYAEVKELPEFGGVLREDTVMIDVDDGEQAEKLMSIVEEYQLRCRVTCTSRGKHFTFKNSGVDKCGTHLKLACGLIADIKYGGSSVEVLKVDGEERFCEWGELNPEAGEYDALPKWLHPVTTKMDFLTTTCRNSDLYGYILVLQTQLAMTNDECRQTIQIINDYVLPEPLPQNELDVVMRDEAFEKPIFFEGKRFLHDSFANWMINQHHIKRINGQLHIYKDGIYRSGYRNIEYLMLKAYPQMKRSQRTEVIDYMEARLPENAPADGSTNLIAFRNGLLNFRTGELIPFDPEHIVLNMIPWDYVPDAYSELADNTLNKLACNDPEIRMLLEECIGYCFFRRNTLQKAFILTGTGSNGKSTFLEMLKQLLGDDNISQLDIGEMDDRFSTALMASKLANIGDDVSSDFLQGKSVSFFKKTVTGNGLKAENKGQTPFFFKPYTKLLFSANRIPRMKDGGEAVTRRLVIIPFQAKFSRDDPDFDYDIETKLQSKECMEYLARVGIIGLNRALDNKGFTYSSKVASEVAAFEKDNNPLLGWLEDFTAQEDAETEADAVVRKSTMELYSSYEMYCCNNGYRPIAHNHFSKQLQEKFGLISKRQTIGGKKMTYLVFA